MVIGRIFKKCKKHGMTEHAVYQYEYKTVRCLECEKNGKARRYANPEKRKHDASYTRNWIGKNKEHVKQLQKNYAEKKYRNKAFRVLSFLIEELEVIVSFGAKIESPLTISDIKKHCIRFDITSIKKVKEFIEVNKRSQLKVAEDWKQSTIIKNRHKVRYIYSELPEMYKEKIRAEYKIKALIIVNQKMEKLLS